MPTVSVIIPCYNQGHFVDEAVNSVLAQSFDDYEIIIVNDGSTDPATNRILSNYSRPRTTVLQTTNHRLAGARNNGIRAATGTFILPLDSDDRIGPSYLEKGVKAMEMDRDLGIVYCEAEFFGAKTGKWELPPYRFPDILLGNRIFCTALFRRTDWETVGGYRPELPVWEDYDFWLSIIELGRGVYRIPEILFYYRQHPESMMANMTRKKLRHPYPEVMRNHQRLLSENWEFMANHIQALRDRLILLEDTVDRMERSRLWRLRTLLRGS